MSDHDTTTTTTPPPPPAYHTDEKTDDRKHGSGGDDDKVLHHTGGSGSGSSADPELGLAPSGRAQWFGGKGVVVGRRIGPVLASLATNFSEDSDDSSAILNKQKAAEAKAAIQYRTCSWQKTAMLLFSEYICLVCLGLAFFFFGVVDADPFIFSDRLS